MIQKELQNLDTNELSPRKIFFDKACVSLLQSLELPFACIRSYGTFFSKFQFVWWENKKFSGQMNFQVQMKVVIAGNLQYKSVTWILLEVFGVQRYQGLGFRVWSSFVSKELCFVVSKYYMWYQFIEISICLMKKIKFGRHQNFESRRKLFLQGILHDIEITWIFIRGFNVQRDLGLGFRGLVPSLANDCVPLCLWLHPWWVLVFGVLF